MGSICCKCKVEGICNTLIVTGSSVCDSAHLLNLDGVGLIGADKADYYNTMHFILWTRACSWQKFENKEEILDSGTVQHSMGR